MAAIIGSNITCSGHGSIQDGACVCDPAWVLVDCSVPWTHYRTLFDIYQAAWFSAYIVLLCLSAWRVTFLIRVKPGLLHQRGAYANNDCCCGCATRIHRLCGAVDVDVLSPRARRPSVSRRDICTVLHAIFKDMQVLTLTCIWLTSVFYIATFIDPFSMHHIWNASTCELLYILAEVFLFTACGLILRVFIAIQSRYHAPTRHVLRACDVLIMTYQISDFACVVIQPFNIKLSNTLFYLASAGYVILLVIGASVYLFALLGTRPGTEDTRRAMRVIQVIGVIGGVLCVVDYFLAPPYMDPVFAVSMGAAFRSLEFIAVSIILYVMGRIDQRESTRLEDHLDSHVIRARHGNGMALTVDLSEDRASSVGLLHATPRAKALRGAGMLQTPPRFQPFSANSSPQSNVDGGRPIRGSSVALTPMLHLDPLLSVNATFASSTPNGSIITINTTPSSTSSAPPTSKSLSSSTTSSAAGGTSRPLFLATGRSSSSMSPTGSPPPPPHATRSARSTTTIHVRQISGDRHVSMIAVTPPILPALPPPPPLIEQLSSPDAMLPGEMPPTSPRNGPLPSPPPPPSITTAITPTASPTPSPTRASRTFADGERKWSSDSDSSPGSKATRNSAAATQRRTERENRRQRSIRNLEVPLASPQSKTKRLS